MSEDEVGELERALIVNELIGLGEAQRKLYNKLLRKKDDNLLNPYELHEKELQLLISYEKSLQSG